MANESENKIGASELPSKVLKGSIWTLFGNIAPLVVAPITTPFTIRLLGAEGYGIFSLVGLIPLYLSFADFGMQFASTKFASGAYAESDAKREAKLIRTSALITTCFFLPIAAAVFFFTGEIAAWLNVPENRLAEATLALRIATVTLYISFLNGIFNSPQLSRLRMGLNALINSVPRVLALVAVPVVLYLGYGVVGAIAVGLVSALCILVCHLVASRNSLPELFDLSFDGDAVEPLLKFGGGFLVSSVAAVLLTNAEKVILASVSTPAVYANYAVAYRLSEPMTLFALAATQSLVPAFSQLQSESKKSELRHLFSTSLNWVLLTTAPLIAVIFTVAEPLLKLWAGKEIGSSSLLPMCVMLFGLIFNIMAFVPYAAIIAEGRTKFLAMVYAVELVPYSVAVWVLTTNYGAAGAAMSWSLRVVVDTIVLFLSVKRSRGLTPDIERPFITMAALAIVFLPAACFAVMGRFELWMLAVLAASLSAYALLVIRYLVSAEEREWVTGRARGFLGR